MPPPEFLDAADRIGRRLCRDAFWAGRRCTWLGWVLSQGPHGLTYTYRAQNPTLYDGTAGIALFLSRLVRLTRDPVVRETLIGAVTQIRDAVTDPDPALRFGFHGGLTGIGASLIQAGVALEDEELARAGVDLIGRLSGVAPDGTRLDVLGGSAGVIPTALWAGTRFGREELVATALAHGELLLRSAVQSDRGWSWATAGLPGPDHLIGYAHGAGGIACALLELYRTTGEGRFRDAAVEGLRYERGHYSTEHRNWPDLRSGTGSGTPTYPAAWCHGAPGVGCSRLRVRHLLADDEHVLAELDSAAETTAVALGMLKAPGQSNYCLCHGAAGCADVLLETSRALARPQLRDAAEELGRDGFVRFHQTDTPWPCGLDNGREPPNLMLGLAGVGYFYLRIHSPDDVPSMLVLAPEALAA